MTWNYRIVKYADGRGYGLHEVYYDKKGKEISMTETPAIFVGDDPEEIHGSMIIARTDAIRRPIFEEPESWSQNE